MLTKSLFWKGKKVVVTGARGMIGSYLCEQLVILGAKVFGMDNGSRGHNHNSAVKYTDTRLADVTSPGNCVTTFKDAFAVFNLAAEVGGVYYNISHQASQYWLNTKLQTVPVIAAAHLNIPIFLQTSSVCIYADGYNSPAVEENGHIGEPERSNAGYAWAKRLGERICSWAFAGSETRHVIARPTNVYGERDYFDDKAHVIPALIKKFCAGKEEVQVFGRSQGREFIHADDVAKGMIVLAEKGICGEAYNLGTNGWTHTTIQNLAELIKFYSRSESCINYVMDIETGDSDRWTDSSKAGNLGWRASVGLEMGLERTVCVYQA